MNAEHWAQQHERGHALFLRLTSFLVRYLPIFILQICIWVVCSYFFITSAKQRRYIAQYQYQLKQTFPNCPLPRYFSVYLQFISFGQAIVDRFAVWQNKIQYQDLVVEDTDNLYDDIRQTQARGQILICSHLGNIEICRALASHHTHFKMNVLVHSQHAQAFNQALKNAGASDINLIEVSQLNGTKMLELANRLDKGEWLAIAADRIPIHGEKTVAVQFLGKKTYFPQGAWLMAQLLKAKTNTVFVLKEQGRYHLVLRRFSDVPPLNRSQRAVFLAQQAQRYADELAQQAARHPLQWFNFYNFWIDPDEHESRLLPRQN